MRKLSKLGYNQRQILDMPIDVFGDEEYFSDILYFYNLHYLRQVNFYLN